MEHAMKSDIIELLGETELLLPALIAEGLAANDRVKARLSVLQAAVDHACDPANAHFSLTPECRAAGVDAVPMETLVNGATIAPGECITAPSLAVLGTAIWQDIGRDDPCAESGRRGAR